MADEDAISLSGTIGTWVGVGIGFIALVGIIGPWLAIQASRSERQQALSQLQDKNQDYITKGYGIGMANRYFRKVRTPTLFRYYAFRIPEANQLWTLRVVQSTTCRTGWARLCRLVEAYSIPSTPAENARRWRLLRLPYVFRRQTTSPRKIDDHVPIVNDNNGTLRFEASHTWLPVSRHWIMTIGLLGRYGKRNDRGRAIEARNVRPDLLEERALVDPDMPPQFDSDIDLPGYKYRNRNMIQHDDWKAYISSADGNEFLSIVNEGVYGKTGEFEQLNPTDTIPCSVVFHWHNQAETGLRGPRNEPLSPLSLYWLATGFLPILTRPGQVERVVQLTDFGFWEVRHANDNHKNKTGHGEAASVSGDEMSIQESDSDSDGPTSRSIREVVIPSRRPLLIEDLEDHARPKTYAFFTLQVALDRPNSIRMATEALGGILTPVYTWQKVPAPDLKTLSNQERQYLQGLGTDQNFAAQSRWVYMKGTTMKCENAAFFARRDLQILALHFLRLPWNAWGYIIHRCRDSYWSCLLQEVLLLARPSLEFILDFPGSGLVVDGPLRKAVLGHVDRWHHKIQSFDDQSYDEPSLRALFELETRLRDAWQTPKAVQEVLCVLLMTNRPFRDAVLGHLQSRLIFGAEPLELVVDPSEGEVRWSPDGRFVFEKDVIFVLDTEDQREYSVSRYELAMAGLRTGLGCDLWLTALDAEPLMEFVRRLDHLVYVA